MYNTRNHPIIKNENNFGIQKKLVTIHTEDRDITKYPYPNEFEVMLPDKIKNVKSMRLTSIIPPHYLPVFSNQYQNTKLSFCILTTAPTASINPDDFKTIITITIDEGSYTPTDLANAITLKMNKESDKTSILCKYNSVTRKFTFASTSNSTQFAILCNYKHTYNTSICRDKIVFEDNINWGLPFHLGFKKAIYICTLSSLYSSADFKHITQFSHETTKWTDISESSVSLIHPENPYIYLEDENQTKILSDINEDKQHLYKIEASNLDAEQVMYVEMDKYNDIGELTPNLNLNNMGDGSFKGEMQSIFSKIPLNTSNYFELFESNNEYNPPIENVSKLKFKFRFHDGRLVDFNNKNFTFMIEFISLTNEQSPVIPMRIPGFNL